MNYNTYFVLVYTAAAPYIRTIIPLQSEAGQTFDITYMIPFSEFLAYANHPYIDSRISMRQSRVVCIYERLSLKQDSRMCCNTEWLWRYPISAQKCGVPRHLKEPGRNTMHKSICRGGANASVPIKSRHILFK